jgi:HD-GYP domain-containing protein (c-di-GMP phosphodiesterase class II)/HAMP domain-containing protein
MPSAHDPGSFGSRVARRVFVLFLLCALVPTGLVGVFAWRSSSRELERSAREHLRRDSKGEGMNILSRLIVAEGLLRAAAARRGGAAVAAEVSWLSLEAQRPSELAGGAPSAAERAALAAGRSVLRVPAGGRARLVYAREDSERLLVASIDPTYLWSYDADDPDAALTVASESGELLFSSLGEGEARALLDATLPAEGEAAVGATSLGTETQIAEPWLLFLASRFEAPSWWVVRSQSREATLAPLSEFRGVFGWTIALALLVVTALSSIQIRRTLRPVHLLARAAARLGEGRWDTRAGIETRDEFGELGNAFDGMAARVERHVKALASSSAFGVALSDEPSEVRLVELVLKALRDVTSSASTTMHRPLETGGLQLLGREGPWSGPAPAAEEAVRRREPVLRPAEAGAPACFAQPLLDRQGVVWVVLQISGPHDEHGAPLESYGEPELAAARSIASQATVSLRNRVPVDEFRSLFEGLIELTVTALDEKSPYTGGHCRRVPILAELLADAVCRTREGAFAAFEFSPAERYELRLAALLHDFGKVVTPVHVMDKSTKLETIHDRIELVAARYAALRHEREVARLRARLIDEGFDPGFPPGEGELRDELAFLRACNVGGEDMDPAHMERIRAVAANRLWHDADGVRRSVLTPEEVENLCVRRGTLNERERKLIEEHAALTIRLLQQLPFPPQLRGVPRIAGSHHERIDGGGYPLGLAGAQITLQGRLLGLADVFEALTAPDRPYREPLTVSRAVDELRELVKRNHLDAELFDVFLRENVHLRYAREHLRPEQLDDATLEALARLPGGPLPTEGAAPLARRGVIG